MKAIEKFAEDGRIRVSSSDGSYFMWGRISKLRVTRAGVLEVDGLVREVTISHHEVYKKAVVLAWIQQSSPNYRLDLKQCEGVWREDNRALLLYSRVTGEELRLYVRGERVL